MKIKLEKYKHKEFFRIRKIPYKGKWEAIMIYIGYKILWIWRTKQIYNEWSKQA